MGNVRDLSRSLTVSQPAAAKILLVKAIEELHTDAVGGDRMIDAITAAGEPDELASWLERRADFLLGTDLAPYKPLVALGAPATVSVFWLVLGGFVAGMLSNFLDPDAQIHVLFNPVTLLILWNLAVYAFVLGRRVMPGEGRLRMPGRRKSAEAGGEPARVSEDRSPPRRVPFLVKPVVTWVWWLRQRFVAKVTEARNAGSVARNFAADWFECAWPRLAIVMRRALALGSVGLVAGALAGMYVRGLGLEYNFVWRSTFITDPDTITRVLALVFGPAAWALGVEPPSLPMTNVLLTPQGMSAAYWIHLYAVMTLALVIAPRAVVAIVQSLRLRFGAGKLRLDLEDPYFVQLVDRARRYRLERVVREVKEVVEVEAKRFSEGVIAFVTTSLYNEAIVPRLRAFREAGGKIADLKRDLQRLCENFGPRLQEHLDAARREFEASISSRVHGLLRVDLATTEASPGDLRTSIGGAAGSSAAGVGGAVGTSMADPIALTVSSALALVAGTVSGGFGQSLGTALLVGLGASGPVGFLVGALATLVAAGGAYLLGRDKLAASIEQVHLPATVVKTVLRESRLDAVIDEGREKCRTQIREMLAEQTEPLPERLANEIWKTVKPMLGDEMRSALPRSEPPHPGD